METEAEVQERGPRKKMWKKQNGRWAGAVPQVEVDFSGFKQGTDRASQLESPRPGVGSQL